METISVGHALLFHQGLERVVSLAEELGIMILVESLDYLRPIFEAAGLSVE